MTICDVNVVRDRWRILRGDVHENKNSKVLGLSEAVQRYVQEGDTLYFGGSMARPNAAMFEVARQFWGKHPGFTLAAPAIANQHAPLIHAGLFSRVISSIHAITFPSPAPHPIYVAADKSGSVVFEDWSLLTIVQRLMAGAFGFPFFPTRSLIGTDMAKVLAAGGCFSCVPNPFGADKVQVVRALTPDVTFLHGLAADEKGNVIVCPPFYDGNWAALAATRSVVVTVERLVDSATIRRYASLVQLPAERVSAVCEVPLGGHPNSVPGDLVPEIGGYPDDYDFLENLREAGMKPGTLDAWSSEWITGPKSHSEYLAQLGAERIHALRGRARDDGWQFDLPKFAEARTGTSPTKAECHVVLAMRTLIRRLTTGRFDAILAGLGVSSLAAWMAAIQLKEAGTQIPLMVEAGMYGYLPFPADPFLFNYRNMFDSRMLSDVLSVLGVMTCGPHNRAIGVLGAAQIDRAGNLNTTRVAGALLTGSGGANDITSGASEVLVTIPHSPMRLVGRVEFVTSSGRSVETIVTSKAVLERENGDFRLTRVYKHFDLSLDELVKDALAGCGWPLGVAPNVEIEPMPEDIEIRLARLLDPLGMFIG